MTHADRAYLIFGLLLPLGCKLHSIKLTWASASASFASAYSASCVCFVVCSHVTICSVLVLQV
jgi:hypothetical protein